MASTPRFAAFIIVVASAAGLVITCGGWILISNATLRSPDGIVILEADPGPYKERPANPGGLEIPFLDMASLNPERPRPESETLLPAPEIPLTLTSSTAVAPTGENPPPLPDPTSEPVEKPTEVFPATPGDTPEPDAAGLAVTPVAIGTNISTPTHPPMPLPRPFVVRQAVHATVTAGAGKAGRVDEPDREALIALVHAALARPVDAAGFTHGSSPSGRTTTVPSGRDWYVQVAAARGRAAADQEWRRLQQNHVDILGTRGHRTVPVAGGDFHRIQAGPLRSNDEAVRICGTLKARKIDCFVVAR